MKKSQYKYIIGVDEVGRGPLAGPVAVGVVRLHIKILSSKMEWAKDFRDSKKLSPKARDAWLVKIDQAKSEGWLEYAVAFVSPSVIDRKGLSYSIRIALEQALNSVNSAKPQLGGSTSKLGEVRVLLDGGLHAPPHYLHQETIIKGDEKVLAIALASIVAKTARDKKMVALAKKFPAYGFEKHKGYGTRAHYKALKKHGITKHHRKSFLRKFW